MSFHGAELVSAVREGRKNEFAAFKWPGEPDDPFSEDTFIKSRLQWDKAKHEKHAALLKFYKKLIQIRKEAPVGSIPDKINISGKDKILSIARFYKEGGVYLVAGFNEKRVAYKAAELEGSWRRLLDSSDAEWLGPGAKSPQTLPRESELLIEPFSLSVYQKEL